MTKRIAVFPGSFDPFTIGHKAILEKAMPLFDSIIIAIGINTDKRCMFTPEQRLSQIAGVYKENSKISVETYTCLTTDFCKQKNASFIIRGVRNAIDFEFEKTIAHMNSDIASDIETLFFVTPKEYSHISSSIVRELIKYKSPVTQYIPGEIV